MSLKSIVGKVFGKKQQEVEPVEDPKEINHELSFDSTMVEKSIKNEAAGEIEIFVNNEKTNIYDISSATRIGRDPSQVDISIPELIVSKLHCTLYIKNGAVFIKDENSTNGTFINNRKVTEQELNHNDAISLGKKGTVRLIFNKPPETDDIPETGADNESA
ncbi:MAG: FHA domain-containing protein [bacterium]|nr:FHA domain-containing protein [bacterium]